MKRVLIVEDDPMVAMINMEYLSRIPDIIIAGHTSNRADTIDFLDKNEVDLILLDIFLGGDSGLDILKEIRERDFSVDVIMITSANGSDEIKKALSLGSVDYLIKPFDFDRFKCAIGKFTKRTEFFKENKLTQEELDTLYQNVDECQSNLPKGLNLKTLELIKMELESFRDEFSIKDISKATDISNVTIKKYLDYLEKIGTIKGYVTYGNVGRPQYLYRKNL